LKIKSFFIPVNAFACDADGLLKQASFYSSWLICSAPERFGVVHLHGFAMLGKKRYICFF